MGRRRLVETLAQRALEGAWVHYDAWVAALVADDAQCVPGWWCARPAALRPARGA
jgi:hypothetical protein